MTPDEFVAKHGFPGTPAGDRMRASLERVLERDRELVETNGVSNEEFAAMAVEAKDWADLTFAAGAESWDDTVSRAEE